MQRILLVLVFVGACGSVTPAASSPDGSGSAGGAAGDGATAGAGGTGGEGGSAGAAAAGAGGAGTSGSAGVSGAAGQGAAGNGGARGFSTAPRCARNDYSVGAVDPATNTGVCSPAGGQFTCIVDCVHSGGTGGPFTANACAFSSTGLATAPPDTYCVSKCADCVN